MGGVTVHVVTEFVDVESGRVRRAADEEYVTDLDRAAALERAGLVRILGPEGNPAADRFGWGGTEGRWLETADVPAGGWARVVACLNVWDDLDALRHTLPTWFPHVDAVIAVDGAYRGAPARECASTDGTLRFLEGLGPKVEIVRAPGDGSFWPHQVEKRNQYLARLRPGDLAFVVDADEFVSGGERLRDLPAFEVGWCVYRKWIYRKAQNFPRLLAASIHPRYDGRHYWLTGDRGRITDCQTGGPGYDHAFVPVEIDNTQGRELRGQRRDWARRIVTTHQYGREAPLADDPPAGRESLRVAQVTSLDAGMVVFRFHSAINACSPHESVMGSTDHGREYESPRQFNLATDDRWAFRRAVAEADVVHCHLGWHEFERLGVRAPGELVVHHHGTMYRNNPARNDERDRAHGAALRLVSNPELTKYAEDLRFLPNPVPVARYRRMRERLWRPDPDGYVRVGHSPSKRENKGTEDFLAAVDRLRARGVRIRPVLIEHATHAESVRRKAAECDLFFDSFWLGLQCSGIEAAAMGIPVIAGDADVAAWHGGENQTPYLFADTGDELADTLAYLAEDPEAATAAGDRVASYVTRHHDYAAVVARYLDLLDEAVGWRARLNLGGPRFLLRS